MIFWRFYALSALKLDRACGCLRLRHGVNEGHNSPDKTTTDDLLRFVATPRDRCERAWYHRGVTSYFLPVTGCPAEAFALRAFSTTALMSASGLARESLDQRIVNGDGVLTAFEQT